MKIGEDKDLVEKNNYGIEIVETWSNVKNGIIYIGINWQASVGFGQAEITIDGDKTSIDTEYMSNEFVYQLFIAWAKTMERDE